MVRQMRVEVFGGDVGRMLGRMAEDLGIETGMRERIRGVAGEK